MSEEKDPSGSRRSALPRPPEAPRFQAFLHRVEGGRPVLRMTRVAWEAIRGRDGLPVEIDVKQTPLGQVGAQVAAAIARPHASGISRIEVYRFDPKDAPTPYNLDRYLVLENIAGRWDLEAIGNSASTEDNQNLRDYLRRYVFLVKEDAGPDHWLPELPATVLSIIRRAP
jgi:hypothetical protein